MLLTLLESEDPVPHAPSSAGQGRLAVGKHVPVNDRRPPGVRGHLSGMASVGRLLVGVVVHLRHDQPPAVGLALEYT